MRRNVRKKLGELEEKRRETEKLSKQSSKLKNDIKEHKEKRRDLQSNEVNLRRKTEELKLNYSRTEARLHTIREMEQNYDGYNYAVKYIMRSGISGIEGVVGETVKVPAGLETAIETALGAAMQNIIVADSLDRKSVV